MFLGQIDHNIRTGKEEAQSQFQGYNSIGMKHYKLTAVIWKEGRHYVSKCPELGVASFGPTPAKAQSALTEAVELYISNAKKLGMFKDIKPALTLETRFTAPLEVAAA
jgi:predicted RNase H-like HicB family nuclease